ncbi:MAG: ROK family protein, partial [Longimicrobiales bacterium]|nr:ROK family protein [Longimicrobiales bacterium]
GVGSPGAVDRVSGRVVQSPNLGWRDYPLRDRVQELADWPVVVDNDANCAAFGEYWVGAGRGTRSMIGVVVGTGIGGGIILDGRLLHGASDAAGEIGHTTVNFAGRRCACGNYGCVEAYASGPNIAARAREGLEAGAESVLVRMVEGRLDRVTAATVYEAVVEGDVYAADVMMETARILGAGIASLINVLNPEAVVIMGGVTRAGRVLFDPLRAEIRRRTFRVASDACRILPAQLPETAGVVGAAGICRAALADGPR